MTDFVETGSVNPRVPTRGELELIRDSILLPMMLDIAEKNRQEVDRASYTFKPLFAKLMFSIMNSMSDDLSKVRREMKQRNIKVVEEEQLGEVLYFRFFCRGYTERFGMMREVMKAEISVRLGQYTSKMLKR